jgi:RNAse (barnase) inhibitor barstar
MADVHTQTMPRVSSAIISLHSSFVLNIRYNQARQLWHVVLVNVKTKTELEFDSLEDMKGYLERLNKPRGLR